VLFVAGPQRRRAPSQILSRIVEELLLLGHRVVEAQTLTDGRALLSSGPSFGAVVLDWDVSEGDGEVEARAALVAARLRSDLYELGWEPGPCGPPRSALGAAPAALV
jgi:hypothetical protein